MTSKYSRIIHGAEIDVYDILVAYDVRCPAVAHAIKKLLMPGKRGGKSYEQDIAEAGISIERAKKLPSPSKMYSGLDSPEFTQTGLDFRRKAVGAADIFSNSSGNSETLRYPSEHGERFTDS